MLKGRTTEPNVEIASKWWSETENVWTPFGWKDHLFIFNALYTGAIIAEPYELNVFPRKHAEKWKGQGIQLTITPTSWGEKENLDDLAANRNEPFQLTNFQGGRVGDQGWDMSHETPVLWTRFRQIRESQKGILIRQDAFAHLHGGKETVTGIEPLFAWIRVSVEDMNEMIPRDKIGVLVRINAPHIELTMDAHRALTIHHEKAKYPRELNIEQIGEASRPGCFVIEPDNKVRLAVLPGRAESIEIRKRGSNDRDYIVLLMLTAKKGAFADILLPFIPVERNVIEEEIKLGYDGALDESDRFWSAKPKLAATIKTPEPLINDAIKIHTKFAEIVAEKNPETGEYSALTASMQYASVWATPVTMLFNMALDPMGYHSVVEKYLKIFKKRQGTSKPPGPDFGEHHGYLSSPRSLSAIDWLTDHGAILYTISLHGLLSHDDEFIKEYLDTIIKACEFIRDARKIKSQGVPGIMPPAYATDCKYFEQSLWTDGWVYKGLATAVRLLKRINNPRAAEFEKEAGDYRKVLIKALREKMKNRPTWKGLSGKKFPIVPMALSGNPDETHQFYLDTGPLFLVFAGLLDADDKLMRNILHFFREGPNHRFYDPRGGFSQPAVLVHEMSSSEPCYSWNLYHSNQPGDRQHFLECMYSLFSGAMSRQTFSGCETRGGINSVNCTFALAFNAVRLAVIDDVIEPGSLHLLRLVPLAWLTTETETQFDNMATEFGPVSLRFRLSPDMKTLIIKFKHLFKHHPKNIILHVPPIEKLRFIVVNNKRYATKSMKTRVFSL